MFDFFKKSSTDKVIKLVYPADVHLCPDCGSYIQNKVCPRCKKIKKAKSNG